jgi:secondary thiamine-phosphate synthase enzyme
MAGESVSVRTGRQVEMVDITGRVRQVVEQSGVTDGLCVVYVPHTTAGVLINEGADPDVMSDLVQALERMVPEQGLYRHGEGNSPAHVKAVLVGSSVTVLVEGARLRLGTWQAIFFAEFDGPRSREVLVDVFPG